MYERPETPNPGPGSGEEKARSEASDETSSLPEARYTPPSNGAGDSPVLPGQPPTYNNAPAQDPYSWQPGQYAPPTQPQGGYTPPVAGQPTQYMPPQQGYAPDQYGLQQPPQYPAPYQGGYPQQPTIYGSGQPAKDSTIALLLELIGLVGFLGIGHIYAGKTNRGIGLLVGWFLGNIIAWWFLLPAFTAITCGVGCLMFIPMLMANLGVPIGSGLWIKNELDRERAAMGMR
jgi:hypothetical protein